MSEPDQYQNPRGDEGRKVMDLMNTQHKDVTTWALAQLPQMKSKRILDLGCGGGALLRILATEHPGAFVDGVDISADAVAYSQKRNSAFIEWGRMAVTKGSAASLPFPDGTFDLITAVETYFFWPDLGNTFKAVAAKLKSKGVLLVVSEMYPDDEHKAHIEEMCATYHMQIRENSEVQSLLEAAGLKTQTVTKADQNWVAFIAVKGRSPV
ncbi:MAG: class I SAM-dependent methyltransferase [Candidatus Methanomethylophilus sp.]|nr:class I SAM-dependent methyltransferase [Methanomethylophilus sp.]MDD3233225.1 class I SAM-dependent methyltransferase [Methanomethylophilus sp.]MDD4222481.1 class I SAM-dependent methyltransferase [Methanomethylophilus sp.]